MDNSYSNAILNLLSAYNQRISNYILSFNKINSLCDEVFQYDIEKKNLLVNKLTNIINNNIEVMNILRNLLANENDIFALNRELVEEINERLESSHERIKPSQERLEPSQDGIEPSQERLEPSNERTEASKERIESSKECTEPSKEGLESSQERKEPSQDGIISNIDLLKEIEEILSNSLCLPVEKSKELEETKEEIPPPALTPEQVREKIKQTKGILEKPFLEYFKGKYKFDKIPSRLALIMEEFCKKPTVTQRHIGSIGRTSWATVGRAFSVLRKQGWIKLETSKKNRKYILTDKGKEFIEKTVNSL